MNNSKSEEVKNLYLVSTAGDEMNPITQFAFDDEKKIVSLVEVSYGSKTETYKLENYEEFKKELIQKVDEVNKIQNKYHKANNSLWDHVEKNISNKLIKKEN